MDIRTTITQTPSAQQGNNTVSGRGKHSHLSLRWLMFLLLTLFLSTTLLVACSDDEAPTPPDDGTPTSLARVSVTGTGLFEIDADTLASLGWTAESPLTLTRNGEPRPYEIQNGSLYFYLPDDLDARYSPQHVMWLSYGGGSPAVDVPTNNTPLATVMAEQRLTANEQYSADYVGEPWFWRTLAGPSSDNHEIPTPGRQAGAVTIMVRAAGVTEVPHQMTVLVGDVEAGTMSWSDQVRHDESFTVEMPAGDLLSLTFDVPQGESGVDISMLDEVIISYPSQPLTTDGIFYGSVSQEGMVKFEGASDDLSAWQIKPTPMPLTVQPEGVFVPANQPLFIAERAKAQKAILEQVDNTTIETEGADYIAIVVPELLETVEPLLAFHREQGLSVLTLTPQQVYDAYNAGTVDPIAFQSLLIDGQSRWTTKPRFVLLVGDSTYDPNGYQNELPPTYLPSPFIRTVFGGETVSDNLIADLDDDGYPDVALGRLPARSADQLETMISKITTYSQQPPEGDWRERVLFTADPREGLFKDTSERLRSGVTSEMATTIEVYPEVASDALSEMLPVLNQGNLIVNYVGHGSVQQWGRDQLLTVENVGELSNGDKLPIFINMTCLTGLFSHPSQESLAETLLWAQNGGAIAAVAPSSLTLPTNQSALNSALLEELLATGRPTVGEALMRAKRVIPLTNDNEHDIVATFNLLGDPALVVATRN